jgi:hypothetical protein
MNVLEFFRQRFALAIADESQRPAFADAVRPATDPKFGDYQANGSMAIAKASKRNPREIANEVAEAVDLAKDHPEIVARLTQLALAWKATLPTTVDPSCISVADRAAAPAPLPAPAAPNAPAKKATPDRAAAFTRMDTNRDGLLTPDEYVAGQKGAANIESRFKNFDQNGDGKLSREEFINPAGR